jgi:hypothetical protein
MEGTMSDTYEDKIKQQAQPYLVAGEHVIAGFVAQPRGATTARIGGLGPGSVGGMKVSRQNGAAERAGLQVANPMSLALTESRLLVFRISKPIAMGKGGDVKDLISAAPLSDVDSIEIKRLLVGKIVIVTVRGVAIKLEAGGGANAKGLAQEFARARTTA